MRGERGRENEQSKMQPLRFPCVCWGGKGVIYSIISHFVVLMSISERVGGEENYLMKKQR